MWVVTGRTMTRGTGRVSAGGFREAKRTEGTTGSQRLERRDAKKKHSDNNRTERTAK